MSSNNFNSYTVHRKNSCSRTRAYPYQWAELPILFVKAKMPSLPFRKEMKLSNRPRDGGTSVVQATQVRRLGLDR